MHAIFFCAYECDEPNDSTVYQVYRRPLDGGYEAKLQPGDVLLMSFESKGKDEHLRLSGDATREEQEVLGDLLEIMRYERDDWSDFIFEYDT